MDGSARPAHLQDLRTHLVNLVRADKLTRVSREIDKDTEPMPLVRWQFRGPTPRDAATRHRLRQAHTELSTAE